MGRTRRKTSKYLELYRKKFKRKVNSVLRFTPPLLSKEEFLCLFVWVSWELGYYAALNRKVIVLEVGNGIGKEPEFISNYPKAYLTNNGLNVVDNVSSYGFLDWLNGMEPGLQTKALLAHQSSQVSK